MPRTWVIEIYIPFQVISAATVSIVIYLCIDQINFIKGVLGTDLVIAASGLIIASGCLLFIWSILGIVAAALENTILLILVSSILDRSFKVISFVFGTYEFWFFWLDQERFQEHNMHMSDGIIQLRRIKERKTASFGM